MLWIEQIFVNWCVFSTITWLECFDKSLIEVWSHGIANGIVASNSIHALHALNQEMLREVCCVHKVVSEVIDWTLLYILNNDRFCGCVDGLA